MGQYICTVELKNEWIEEKSKKNYKRYVDETNRRDASNEELKDFLFR